ncbi:hypothetical protein [Hyalangium sp.]|uniref:hypothetical protein n=1 Tax=Hyalangium sp. TaxID=2028555 RepID=UPI002D405076|nr:hypothetical protein [Hyalangium sp.]HYH95562.1 hypothetical protein [Hyalangium sp.]
MTDAANPQPLGSYTYDAQIYNPTHANAVGTFAGKTLAFEGGEMDNAHLRVLDVSNPTQPKEIAYANTFRESDPGRTDGLFVGAIGIRVPSDGYVYVVDMTRGLLIYREP